MPQIYKELGSKNWRTSPISIPENYSFKREFVANLVEKHKDLQLQSELMNSKNLYIMFDEPKNLPKLERIITSIFNKIHKWNKDQGYQDHWQKIKKDYYRVILPKEVETFLEQLDLHRYTLTDVLEKIVKPRYIYSVKFSLRNYDLVITLDMIPALSWKEDSEDMKANEIYHTMLFKTLLASKKHIYSALKEDSVKILKPGKRKLTIIFNSLTEDIKRKKQKEQENVG